MASPSQGSDTGSTMGLGSIVINTNRPLPEQWTLPSEWNLEKRETYDNWKVDVQCQIASLDKQLHYLTAICPQKDLGVYCPRVSPGDEMRLKETQSAIRGVMQKGIRRC